ncbi:MAG: c-type cytochrome [Herpetosiphon sp.]|nr:c-type cytochrome [Herpetosiphon sp.]
MKRIIILGVWLGAIALIALVWINQTPPPLPIPTPTIPTPNPINGQALFVAKGCASCHAHAAVGSTMQVGPNLSTYRNTSEFLQAWLRDPQAVKPQTPMPNLHLSEQEISDLIAFLNHD